MKQVRAIVVGAGLVACAAPSPAEQEAAPAPVVEMLPPERTDPVESGWTSLWRGASDEQLRSVAVGPTGDTFVLGEGARIVELVTGNSLQATVAMPTITEKTALLVKYGPHGEVRFAVPLRKGATGSAMVATADGGAVVVGSHPGEPVPDEIGGADGHVLRVDAEGATRWELRLTGPLHASVEAIAADPGGGFVVAGVFDGPVADARAPDRPLLGVNKPRTRDDAEDFMNLFVARIDEDGALSWRAEIESRARKNVRDVVVGADGSLVLTGHCTGAIFVRGTTGETMVDCRFRRSIFVVAWTRDGEVRWVRLLSPVRRDGHTDVSDLAALDDGGYALGGWFQGELDGEGLPRVRSHDLEVADGFVVRLGADGAPQWLRRIGGAWAQSTAAVAPAPDGGVWTWSKADEHLIVDDGTPAGREVAIDRGTDVLCRHDRAGGLVSAVSLVGCDPAGLAVAPGGELRFIGALRTGPNGSHPADVRSDGAVNGVVHARPAPGQTSRSASP